MKTVILCGGQGTRLREETEYRPKPLVEIGDMPVLLHIIKIYASFQHSSFILCLGYRGNMIKEYFLDYEAMNSDFTIGLGSKTFTRHEAISDFPDLTVTLANTGKETMTGGRLYRVRHYIDEDTFMLTYGDGVADIDIPALLDFHRSHGKIATVSVFRPTSRFGMLDIDLEGSVQAFMEKPIADEWASCGYFVLNRKVFDYLDPTDDCVFEQRPLQRLAADNQLAAYKHEGFFFAMDTYREYQHLNELWATNKAPWKVWDK